MANAVEKLNGIALASIEKLNGRTEANIEKINGLSFEAALYGPPAIGNTVDRNYGAANVDYGITGDITVGTGDGRALVVVGILNDDDGQPYATECSFTVSGGSAQAFTQLSAASLDHGGGYLSHVSIWGLIAPASGAGEVRYDFNRTCNRASGTKIIEMTGVKQSGGNAGISTGALSGTATDQTSQSQAIDTTAGQFVIDGISLETAHVGASSSVGAGQTEVGAFSSGGKGGSYEEATGASTTMSWSWDTTQNVVWNVVRIISDVYS